MVCVPPGFRRGWLVCRSRRPANARVLMTPVTLAPAVVPKEAGGSPEFPDYPFVHMPRSQIPVVSCPLALARTGRLPSGACTPSALGPVARTYPAVHHYTFFGLCRARHNPNHAASRIMPHGVSLPLHLLAEPSSRCGIILSSRLL